MKIEQLEDKGLAHYSYMVLSEDTREIIIIDPARDPQPYFEYAEQHKASIVGVIETHPHADFISAHLEIHQKKGAKIFTHSLVGAEYPHESFDEGAVLQLGALKLKSLHTPGHSPDSISVVLEEDGTDKAVFTGDTLFIGDVGRPDLRESAGNTTAKREELAGQMYHSTREKLMKLNDDVLVYPAHGAGTLCGKAVSEANSSTIAAEKMGNYALQEMSEEDFIKLLTADQSFVPKYFAYAVTLNKKGAPDYDLSRVKKLENNFKPEEGAIIVDSRYESIFKAQHFPGAINIQNGSKFETWLGTIIDPEESFYLIAESNKELDDVISKAAKIGYELLIKGAFLQQEVSATSSPAFELEAFRKDPDQYTIVDVRNPSELKEGEYFEHRVNIPLPELRERAKEIPAGKPVVVHCAGGYRSAAGSSIIEAALPKISVFDLGTAIKDFQVKS